MPRNFHLMKLVSVFFILTGLANADELTKNDLLLEATWQALHLVDWGTTRNIAKEEGYYEMNPLIGAHPTESEVDNWMFATAILHPIITRLLPKKVKTLGLEWHPRAIWQATSIMVSAGCVANNYAIGLTMRFD